MKIAASARPELLPLVEVVGPHGFLTVHPTTGEVIRCIPFDSSTEYTTITRIDVAEWCDTWGGQPYGRQLDILDVGHWRGDEFTPPEAAWREDVRRAREARANCLRLVMARGAE